MKKILFFLFTVLLALSTTAQTIGDTATLRSAINTDIVPNASGGITATKLNRILNGVMNSMSRQTLVDHPLTIKRGALKDTVSVDYASGAADGVITAANFTKFDKSWGPDGNSPSAGGFIGTLNSQPIPFKVNSVEKMRLTSTGLGIGISSPTYLLQVKGTFAYDSLIYNHAGLFIHGSNNNESVFIGNNAGNQTRTSSYNTAIGQYALNKVTSGERNTAIGKAAAYNLTTGSYNVIIGVNRTLLTTGSGNTEIGSSNAGGIGVSTGSYNTIIGSRISPLVPTADYQLAIGANGNTWIYGRGGKIGINTSDSSEYLVVNGNIKTMGGWVRASEYFVNNIDVSGGDYSITLPGVYRVTVPNASNRVQFPNPATWSGYSITIIISGSGGGDQRASGTYSTTDANANAFGYYKDGYSYTFFSTGAGWICTARYDATIDL